MRLYIKKETDKAYLLYGLNFAERWVPKKAVKIITNSDVPSSQFEGSSFPSSQFEGSSFPSSNRTINNNNDKDRVETVSVPIVDPSLHENSNLNHTGNTNEQLQKPKKKRVYKLDILLKKLEEKNII